MLMVAAVAVAVAEDIEELHSVGWVQGCFDTHMTVVAPCIRQSLPQSEWLEAAVLEPDRRGCPWFAEGSAAESLRIG